MITMNNDNEIPEMSNKITNNWKTKKILILPQHTGT